MNDTSRQRSLSYYRVPEAMTRLDKHLDFINWLTNDIQAICQVVQDLLIHDLWLDRYGIGLHDEQLHHLKIADMEDLLDKAAAIDSRSLAIARAPEKRVIGCCREFATLFCAILRCKGIPARSHCGFATYLANPGYYEDHWICEYWDEAEVRWIKVDPQIDPFQQSFIGADFSPRDVPDSRFIPAGQAWKQCRAGGNDPHKFGIACPPEQFGVDTLYGFWFIRGNLLRDFASLNKVETVPFLARVAKHLTWDSWRLVILKDEELSEQEYALLDTVAELSLEPDTSFEQIRHLYDSQSDLQPPADIITNG